MLLYVVSGVISPSEDIFFSAFRTSVSLYSINSNDANEVHQHLVLLFHKTQKLHFPSSRNLGALVYYL